MTGERQTIFPVLLSGGAGSRLWPLSRDDAPKQLLPLFGEETLLQQAVKRATAPGLFEPLTVIAGSAQRAMLEEQMAAPDAPRATIVIEPVPRNTAAAAAVAALLVSRSRPDALMLLMPTDHLIADAAAFHRSVEAAAVVARQGYFALFGIKPERAATAYGYIRLGDHIAAGGVARQVAKFVEKPEQAAADAFVASGDYLWNSGIFLMPADQLLSELERLEPALLDAARSTLDRASHDAEAVLLDPQAFQRCRSISIDHAVMEHTDKAAVVPADFAWSDVGSWSALWSIADRDESGNVAIGDVLTRETRDSYVRSSGPLIATLGVDNLVVIATEDAVLVAHKDRDQEIRDIVEQLHRRNRERG